MIKKISKNLNLTLRKVKYKSISIGLLEYFFIFEGKIDDIKC